MMTTTMVDGSCGRDDVAPGNDSATMRETPGSRLHWLAEGRNMMSKRGGMVVAVMVALTLSSCATAAPETTALPSSTTVAVSTSSTAEVPATTTTQPSGDPAESVTEEAAMAFGAWIDAVAAADTDLAWDLMAQSSRDAIRSKELFTSMGSEMSEGWGAWATADSVTYGVTMDKAGRTILNVEGTVSQEGMTEHKSVGVPIEQIAGHVLLSPFQEFGTVAQGLQEDAGRKTPATGTRQFRVGSPHCVLEQRPASVARRGRRHRIRHISGIGKGRCARSGNV